MKPENEFSLIKDIKSMPRAQLEGIALDVIKQYHDMTNLAKEAASKLELQSALITKFSKEYESLKVGVNSTLTLYILYGLLSTIGNVALFLILIFRRFA